MQGKFKNKPFALFYKDKILYFRKMKFLRILLFPFAILYGWVTQLRNIMYDNGFLRSYAFKLPVIAVGNLSVGGTGKTPQIEYLIRLLEDHYKIATLSRGYKRHSKGFILADTTVSAAILGDEPYQFYQKFPGIHVAVDEDRKNGIENLLHLSEKPNVILLDDAFQHRKVRAGFYILLTAFDALFYEDHMLPTGNLREGRSGADRADVIIITKCPENISSAKQQEITQKINLDKPVFFTKIAYDDCVFSSNDTLKVSGLKPTERLLLAGIAKPQPFFDHLQGNGDDILVYPDHHHFTETDILNIRDKAKGRKIITTEKDYVRLKNHFSSGQLYYLPIKTSFITNGDEFDQAILNYVQNN